MTHHATEPGLRAGDRLPRSRNPPDNRRIVIGVRAVRRLVLTVVIVYLVLGIGVFGGLDLARHLRCSIFGDGPHHGCGIYSWSPTQDTGCISAPGCAWLP